jgi:hypothetical protein
MIGNTIYIAGGCDGAQKCDLNAGFCGCTSWTSNFVAYNTLTDTYKTLPPMPAPRYRHLACPLLSAIYVFGGRVLGSDVPIESVDKFDTVTSTWTTFPASSNYPDGLGSDNSCSTIGSRIYVMAGYSPDYSVGYNSSFSFTPATGAWMRHADMNVGRGDIASVAYNGRVHVYGGYSTDNFCATLNTHEIYDPVANTWTLQPPMPNNLAEKDDGVVLYGRMYSIGGETKRVAAGCVDMDIQALRDVLVYDDATRLWSNGTWLPDPRMRFAGTSNDAGTAAFIFGGQGPIIDGNTLPLMYTAYTLVDVGRSPTPAPASLTFSALTLGGAIIGTLLVTVALILGCACCCARRKPEEGPTDKLNLRVSV